MSGEETVTKKRGRRTDAEIKAEAKAEATAEITDTLAELKKELDELKERDKIKNAQMANLTVAVETQSTERKLKKTQRRITDQMVRGTAHATGGASHEDLEDGTPWTPHQPDWVTESFPDEQDAKDAIYVWKQAWLDDRPITDIDELHIAMEAFKQGTLNLGTYTPPSGPDAEALASQITG